MGRNSPNRSGGHDESPEAALEHLVVSQDRQQGVQRGCGEADCDRHEGTNEACRRQRAGHGDRDHECHQS
jgi:hypothetical protein